MTTPSSTYRLQLGPSLTFSQAADVLPALARLGVTHVCLSPILQAQTGSQHGYDVTDPTRVRDELGGQTGWSRFLDAAAGHGLGVVLDIVPNHMAASPENPWFADVRTQGRDSTFARCFDIDWDRSRDGRLVYRRFFDVDGLIGVRVEDPDVFDLTHACTLAAARHAAVAGVRVDHVDGLHDPAGYLHRLRDAFDAERSEPAWIVVEKILATSERLPGHWPVDGTTGYDFLNAVTRLLVDAEGLERLDDEYRHILAGSLDLEAVPAAQKRLVLDTLFPEELRRLTDLLARCLPDVDRDACHAALRELTVQLDVYRAYLGGEASSGENRIALEAAFELASASGEGVDPAALARLHAILLDGDRSAAAREFVARWQQFTPAIMGKGYEDTALYVDLRLQSLNEVGGELRPAPTLLGTPAFHAAMTERARGCPHSMNATSTHDTKRSEDVRARQDVLSDLPERFGQAVRRWQRWNQPFVRDVDGAPCPDPDTAWLLYQTLVGAWPLDAGEVAGFAERLRGYLIKATREAKRHTSWLEPHPAWERSLIGFVDDILSPGAATPFAEDLAVFVDGIAVFGAWNSLVQLLLTTTCPGIPDLYQGCESWNFSLVDPDNRRRVDFAAHADRLAELEQLEQVQTPAELMAELAASWRDGRIKLWLTRKLLSFRREHAELFRDGDYRPLGVVGARADHAIAFARQHGPHWVAVVAGRGLARLAGDGPREASALCWDDTTVALSQATVVRNVLDETALDPSAGAVRLDALLGTLPVAVIEGRGAGRPRQSP